jgi:cation diffusion facilitator family transporter
VQEGSKRAIIAAFLANLGIAISKFVGFLITGSAGLLAEAAHSLADTGNQGLLLLGNSRARREATPDHPFGYGRERYFWSFVVALVLFSMGGLFALYEGIEKMRHPHETENLIVAVVILIFAFVLESFSLTTAVRESRHVKPPDMSWWRFIRTSRSPELPVVLLEDTGAEIGLCFAMGGVLLSAATHNPRWDAGASILIGLLLVAIAGVLAVEMKGLLIGESATPEMQRSIRRAIEATPQVNQIIHLRTEHLGPDELLVGVKVEYDRSLTMDGLARAIDETEARIREAVAVARVIYIEPDIAREHVAESATDAN